MNKYEIINLLLEVIELDNEDLKSLVFDCIQEQYPNQFKDAMTFIKKVVSHHSY